MECRGTRVKDVDLHTGVKYIKFYYFGQISCVSNEKVNIIKKFAVKLIPFST